MISINLRLFALSLLFFPLYSLATDFTITATIKMSEKDLGQVIVSLYDSKDTFLKSPIEEISLMHDGSGIIEINLGPVPEGQYAVAAFYDRNSNGKLDRNFLRIPSEKIALSNDIKPKFGPPKWSDTKFAVESHHDIIVTLGGVGE